MDLYYQSILIDFILHFQLCLFQKLNSIILTRFLITNLELNFGVYFIIFINHQFHLIIIHLLIINYQSHLIIINQLFK